MVVLKQLVVIRNSAQCNRKSKKGCTRCSWVVGKKLYPIYCGRGVVKLVENKKLCPVHNTWKKAVPAWCSWWPKKSLPQCSWRSKWKEMRCPIRLVLGTKKLCDITVLPLRSFWLTSAPWSSMICRISFLPFSIRCKAFPSKSSRSSPILATPISLGSAPFLSSHLTRSAHIYETPR